ncbi:hypothetical protein U1Q18_050358 [Sarracenia purpurea var. burkii]
MRFYGPPPNFNQFLVKLLFGVGDANVDPLRSPVEPIGVMVDVINHEIAFESGVVVCVVCAIPAYRALVRVTYCGVQMVPLMVMGFELRDIRQSMVVDIRRGFLFNFQFVILLSVSADFAPNLQQCGPNAPSPD